MSEGSRDGGAGGGKESEVVHDVNMSVFNRFKKGFGKRLSD